MQEHGIIGLSVLLLFLEFQLVAAYAHLIMVFTKIKELTCTKILHNYN